MAKKKHPKEPHEQLLDDLAAVVKKNDIGAEIVMQPVATANGACHEITVTLPNGSTKTITVC